MEASSCYTPTYRLGREYVPRAWHTLTHTCRLGLARSAGGGGACHPAALLASRAAGGIHKHAGWPSPADRSLAAGQQQCTHHTLKRTRCVSYYPTLRSVLLPVDGPYHPGDGGPERDAACGAATPPITPSGPTHHGPPGIDAPGGTGGTGGGRAAGGNRHAAPTRTPLSVSDNFQLLCHLTFFLPAQVVGKIYQLEGTRDSGWFKGVNSVPTAFTPPLCLLLMRVQLCD